MNAVNDDEYFSSPFGSPQTCPAVGSTQLTQHDELNVRESSQCFYTPTLPCHPEPDSAVNQTSVRLDAQNQSISLFQNQKSEQSACDSQLLSDGKQVWNKFLAGQIEDSIDILKSKMKLKEEAEEEGRAERKQFQKQSRQKPDFVRQGIRIRRNEFGGQQSTKVSFTTWNEQTDVAQIHKSNNQGDGTQNSESRIIQQPNISQKTDENTGAQSPTYFLDDLFKKEGQSEFQDKTQYIQTNQLEKKRLFSQQLSQQYTSSKSQVGSEVKSDVINVRNVRLMQKNDQRNVQEQEEDDFKCYGPRIFSLDNLSESEKAKQLELYDQEMERLKRLKKETEGVKGSVQTENAYKKFLAFMLQNESDIHTPLPKNLHIPVRSSPSANQGVKLLHLPTAPKPYTPSPHPPKSVNASVLRGTDLTATPEEVRLMVQAAEEAVKKLGDENTLDKSRGTLDKGGLDEWLDGLGLAECVSVGGREKLQQLWEGMGQEEVMRSAFDQLKQAELELLAESEEKQNSSVRVEYKENTGSAGYNQALRQ